MCCWGVEQALPFLRRFLPYEDGLPSHDTLTDVMNALDPELFKECFLSTAGPPTARDPLRLLPAVGSLGSGGLAWLALVGARARWRACIAIGPQKGEKIATARPAGQQRSFIDGCPLRDRST